jgi:hypothetical protein
MGRGDRQAACVGWRREADDDDDDDVDGVDDVGDDEKPRRSLSVVA